MLDRPHSWIRQSSHNGGYLQVVVALLETCIVLEHRGKSIKGKWMHPHPSVWIWPSYSVFLDSTIVLEVYLHHMLGTSHLSQAPNPASPLPRILAHQEIHIQPQFWLGCTSTSAQSAKAFLHVLRCVSSLYLVAMCSKRFPLYGETICYRHHAC